MAPSPPHRALDRPAPRQRPGPQHHIPSPLFLQERQPLPRTAAQRESSRRNSDGREAARKPPPPGRLWSQPRRRPPFTQTTTQGEDTGSPAGSGAFGREGEAQPIADKSLLFPNRHRKTQSFARAESRAAP